MFDLIAADQRSRESGQRPDGDGTRGDGTKAGRVGELGTSTRDFVTRHSSRHCV